MQAVLIDCSSVIFVDVAGARLFTQVGLIKHNMMDMSPLFFSLCQYDELLIVFNRCALNARKLEFMYIWQTAMVRPMYDSDFFTHVFSVTFSVYTTLSRVLFYF